MTVPNNLFKNTGRLLSYIVVIVGCWVIFGKGYKCNSTPIEDQKPTQTIKEQEKKAVNIEEIRKHDADSFNLVLKAKDDLANKYFNNWQQTDIKLTMAERAVDDLLNDTPNIPDTCQAVVAQVKLGFNTVKEAYAKKDAQALNTINALKSANQTQKDFLKNKDSIYAKMKNAFDTCIASAKYYKQGMDKNKPHNKLAIGPEFNYYPVFGCGIGIDFIHKKGIVISATGMTINNQLYGQAGIKKVISFRKK